MNIVVRLLLLFFVPYAHSWATLPLSPWYTEGAGKKPVIHVELFLSSTCDHCRKADEFFHSLAANNPSLKVQYYLINEDKNALIRFNQLLSEQNMNDFAVPSVYFCNSRWVGFASAERTGRDLLQAINYCKEQIEKEGELTELTTHTLRHLANANRFDVGMGEQSSAWHYTLMLALSDVLSPCSLFCFAGFLAFLFIEDQQKRQLLAGFLFTSAVLMVHYVQQAYTSSFFKLLLHLRFPAALLGLLGVCLVIQTYKKKSNVYGYYGLAFFLGLTIMSYQQTCVINWSGVFQQWLQNQNISIKESIVYQLVYQTIYVLPLILTLIFYLGLLKRPRIAALKNRLFTIGLLFLMFLCGCLIIYPAVLAYFAASLLILLILAVCGYFLTSAW